MCEHCEICEYNQFPAVTVGGTTGDYFIQVPVVSCRYAEYQVVSIANGGNAAKVVVSGDSPPKALSYAGDVVLSDDAYIRGQVFALAAGVTMTPPTNHWDRITHSQKRVFVRIDNAASNSTFVTIRFRARLLTVIPDTSKDTVHPDLMHQRNLQRAERIGERTVDLPERIKGDHTYA